MIQLIKVDWQERKKSRKIFKNDYISSVALSLKKIDTKKLRKLCNGHIKYHALCFDISGTYKYWFAKDTLNQMLFETNQTSEDLINKGGING